VKDASAERDSPRFEAAREETVRVLFVRAAPEGGYTTQYVVSRYGKPDAQFGEATHHPNWPTANVVAAHQSGVIVIVHG